ncbi:MAG: hypothetical protein IV100_04680 [Myxococcales bacterium]|nr:hypothetical protein [Myxococcales bacterium]
MFNLHFKPQYTLASLFMHDTAQGRLILRFSIYALTLAGVVCLLASKMHYTIDVLVAVVIMVLVYLQWRPTVLAFVNEERRLQLPLGASGRACSQLVKI